MRYAVYADRFGWPPSQVDEIPLLTDAWLLPICNEIAAAKEAKKQQANERANRKQWK